MEKIRRIVIIMLGLAAAALILGFATYFYINDETAISRLTVRSTYTWTHPGDARFGGFSGLELDASGTNLIALSDHPALFYATVQRDANHDIVDVTVDNWARLTSDYGNYIDMLNGDTEGLALTRRNGLFLSLEGTHTLNYIFPNSHVVNWIDIAPELTTLPWNRGVEAVAIDDVGRPILFREGFEPSGEAKVFRFEGNSWTAPYTLQKRGNFVPVGADIGPDGRLYLLERGFVPLIGFKTQIRSFSITHDDLGDEQLLFRSHLRQFDNLEGLAAWQDPAGNIRLTTISDDNFKWFQKTQIVEFVVP